MTDELVTLDAVAEELSVSRETARKLCVTGKLPWVPVGTGGSRHARRVRRSTLEAFKRNERRDAVREEMQSIKQTFAGMKMTEQRW